MWFVHSHEDEVVAQSIMQVDNDRSWPHNKYVNYAVDTDGVLDPPLLQRDYSTRELARSRGARALGRSGMPN